MQNELLSKVRIFDIFSPEVRSNINPLLTVLQDGADKKRRREITLVRSLSRDQAYMSSFCREKNNHFLSRVLNKKRERPKEKDTKESEMSL